jgi:hypothetical protein
VALDIGKNVLLRGRAGLPSLGLFVPQPPRCGLEPGLGQKLLMCSLDGRFTPSKLRVQTAKVPPHSSTAFLHQPCPLWD